MENLKKRVLSVLEEIKPQIQFHGGGVELVSVQNGQVVVRISGACVGCPMARATFGAGMEKMIKEKVPGVKKVEFVT